MRRILKRPHMLLALVAALLLGACADNITAPTTTGAAATILTTQGPQTTVAPTTASPAETTTAPTETTAPVETTEPTITVAPPGASDALIAFADTFQSDVDALTLVFYQSLPDGTLPPENCQEILDATGTRRDALASSADDVPGDLVDAADAWYGEMISFVTPCADGSEVFDVPGVSERIPAVEPVFALAESYGWERCEGEVCE